MLFCSALLPVAGSNIGYICKQETREKLRAKSIGNTNSLGYVQSSEHRSKIGYGLLGNRNTKGRPLSEDHRKAISRSLVGNVNLIRSLTGRVYTTAARHAMSLSRTGLVASSAARISNSLARVRENFSRLSWVYDQGVA